MKGACVLVLVAALAACRGGEDEARLEIPAPSGTAETSTRSVDVQDVRVGASASEAEGVTLDAAEFGAGDTVFLSARLEGSLDQANLGVRWSRDPGGPVGEEERFVPLDRSRVVVFRLAPPAGLAPGRYRVELLVGGQEAGRREFIVR